MSYLNGGLIGGWLGMSRGCSATYSINLVRPYDVEKGSLP